VTALTTALTTTKDRLLRCAWQAVDSLHGAALVERAVPTLALTRPVTVWALGKAAAAMAAGAEAALGDQVAGGLVVAAEPARLRTLPVLVGGHPFPTQASVVAGEALLAAARATRPGQQILLCLSGGASALSAAPAAGVRFEDLRDLTRMLLASGAHISEINATRRRLSALGGGKLAAANQGRLSVLGLSDIILQSETDDEDRVWETLGSGPAWGGEAERYLLATPRTLRDAAIALIVADGGSAPVLPLYCGTVEDLAADLVDRAHRQAPGEVAVIVAEPSVTVTGSGIGGRAQHLALLLAVRLAGQPFALVALGSDGRDGPTDAAGAVVDGDTAQLARAHGIDLDDAAHRFDSHPTLATLGCTLPRRSTGTNLCDLYLLSRTT